MRKDGPVAILWPANGRPPERNERWAPRRRCRQSHLRLPDQPEEVDEDKSLTAVSDRCPVAVHRHRATDESVSPRGPSPYASPPPTALFPNYRPPSRLACSAGKKPHPRQCVSVPIAERRRVEVAVEECTWPPQAGVVSDARTCVALPAWLLKRPSRRSLPLPQPCSGHERPNCRCGHDAA